MLQKNLRFLFDSYQLKKQVTVITGSLTDICIRKYGRSSAVQELRKYEK